MQIPITEELEKLAKQYPLSYREIYALSTSTPVEIEGLETVIKQITGFGMSVEEYLLKMCHLRPMTVQELLYSSCSYVRPVYPEYFTEDMIEAVKALANAGDENDENKKEQNT